MIIVVKTLVNIFTSQVKLLSNKARDKTDCDVDNKDQNNLMIEDFNDSFLKYREIKYLYNKTHIQPIYYFYFLLVCLFIIVIGYLQNLITCLVGMLYPMYFSIKALREKNKERIKNWLQYWIIFSIFLNLEDILYYFLSDIQLYFFYKLVFLLICFLPQYNGAKYFYENIIRGVFLKYESDVCLISQNLATRIRSNLLDSSEGE